MVSLLVAVIITALVFDFINGFHDAANAIATVVSTGVLPVRVAVVLAGLLNFVGGIAGTAVAKTIASGFADAGDVTQSGGGQVQCGLPVREGADDARAPPYFPQDALQWVVRANAPPMLLGELVVTQRFLDRLLHELSRPGKPLVAQLGDNLPSLLACRLHILRGVDRLQHRGDLTHLRTRHMREHIPIKVHRAALPTGVGEELRGTLRKSDTSVRDDQAHAFQPAFLQVLEEARPPGLILLGAFDDAEDLAISLGIDGNRHQQRDVANLARPGALHHDAVEVDVGMLTLDRPVPPLIDRRVDLLVEVADRRWRHPRAPQRFRDVLDATNGDPRQIHLDQRLLDGSLTPTIALDDRRLERLTPKLRHLQRNLARFRLQAALVMASPGITTRLGALVALRIA